MIEIYRLILEKGFKPTIVPALDGYHLTLTDPKGKYKTSYVLVDGKFKWFNGVMPFRILKG